MKKLNTIEETTQYLSLVHNYYNSFRDHDGSQKTIYQIWEEGGAFNDSVTPSSFCQEYRYHMGLKIWSISGENIKVTSIGCGNAFVEADLKKKNVDVVAIDCLEEAVQLAAEKGLDARLGDFFKLQPEDLSGTDVMYADGLIGHLFRDEEQLNPFLEQLKSFQLKPGTYLVFSNDAPFDLSDAYTKHPHVDGFWFVGKDFLAEQVENTGFKVHESYYFPYIRPVSGLRNRTIVIAQVN